MLGANRNHLYVVETRLQQSRETKAPLTAQERMEGWRDGAETAWALNKTKQFNEGHERFSLHSLTAGQMLTWFPAPGDRVLASVVVDFDGSQARIHRLCGEYVVYCDSVLGRAVQIGEDTADCAFGHDSIAEQVKNALNGDYRTVQCSLRLVGLYEPGEPANQFNEVVAA